MISACLQNRLAATRQYRMMMIPPPTSKNDNCFMDAAASSSSVQEAIMESFFFQFNSEECSFFQPTEEDISLSCLSTSLAIFLIFCFFDEMLREMLWDLRASHNAISFPERGGGQTISRHDRDSISTTNRLAINSSSSLFLLYLVFRS